MDMRTDATAVATPDLARGSAGEDASKGIERMLFRIGIEGPMSAADRGLMGAH